MTRILLSMGFGLALVMALLLHASAAAEAVPSVKLNLIQAAGSDLKHERIDVINLDTTPADLTGWKLVYRSASGATTTQLLQFQADVSWHVLLDPGMYESTLSKELVANLAPTSPLRQAMQFTAALNHTAGGVQLLDSTGRAVDTVGWGTTASETIRQGDPAPALSATTWLRRYATAGNNATDFRLELQTADYAAHVGSLYEVKDVCSNLTGIQTSAPNGYQVSGDGSCPPIDVCPNLPDIQTALPGGMEWDNVGDCQPIDLCRNLPAIQAELPAGYDITAPGVCEPALPVRNILISELLPNPGGADAGNEFIELYNADNLPAELRYYRLAIGDKEYALPRDVVIAPGAYWTISDTELGVSLPNTTGLPVYLLTTRGVEVAQAPAYKNAGDDMAWGLVDGQWQYSYAPTPGAANIALSALPCQDGYGRDETTGRCRKLVAPVQVTPCADGQYRSETTGRCRTLPSETSLVPCKEGQYRSEATNRCRSLALASTTVKPCADDQFRNPLTNRCKTIASNDDVALADCGEGRERNPDTKRCRNIVTASVPSAAFAPTPLKEAATGFVGWWALGGVGVLAAGYGVWEWRRELATVAARASRFLRRS